MPRASAIILSGSALRDIDAAIHRHRILVKLPLVKNLQPDLSANLLGMLEMSRHALKIQHDQIVYAAAQSANAKRSGLSLH